MQIQRIIQFIEQLSSVASASYDREFLQRFRDRFSLIDSCVVLTSAQMIWIQTIFKERWQLIKNTPFPQITDPSENNAHWLELAHDLAHEIPMESSMQIVLPLVTHTIDLIISTQYLKRPPW